MVIELILFPGETCLFFFLKAVLIECFFWGVCEFGKWDVADYDSFLRASIPIHELMDLGKHRKSSIKKILKNNTCQVKTYGSWPKIYY